MFFLFGSGQTRIHGKQEITPDSKRFLFVPTKPSPVLMQHKNVVSIRAQRPHYHRHLAATPAETPAPKFHSAKTDSDSSTCSSTQVPKMPTAL